MSYYTISHWEADEWTDEMEAIAKDKFGPMIMAVVLVQSILSKPGTKQCAS